ncbi:MAG: lytic transglycosylase F [Deltaproteobacteria bacterium]|nr:MAG: lytic transglycosylase F [Deltaproteobacteria bacterium]
MLRRPLHGSACRLRLSLARRWPFLGRLLFLAALLEAGCPRETPAPPRADADAAQVVIAGTEAAPAPALGDLPEIASRGELRVLVPGSGERLLPRAGTPLEEDRRLIREFARRHHLAPKFILVGAYDELLPRLIRGEGDLVAAQLSVTERRRAKVAFTRPLYTVDEILVGRKGAPMPETLEALRTRSVHVRESSSYAETLAALEVPIVPVPERLDTFDIAEEVAEGLRPLTVVDSHLLEAIETYESRLARGLVLARGRQIAWAVRKDVPELKAALDAFLIERSLTGHTKVRFTGDLDGILKRGEIRVLTRNNAVSYYLHQGTPRGFDYELARMLARDLGVRLVMVVPPTRKDLIPWLLDGRGDLIAASMTITPARAEQVRFTRPYLYVHEVVVQRADEPPLRSIQDLAGRTIHVRGSSSYYRTLRALRTQVPFTVASVPEDMETEEIIDHVARGEFDLTVADEHIAKVEMTWRADIRAELRLPATSASKEAGADESGAKPIAFAVRPTAERLARRVDRFVAKIYRGLEYNMARRRYFENKKFIRQAKAERAGVSGRLSPYDDLLKKYSAMYGLDWRLMAALAYQESHFDPNAESWVGAQGLFQVMPSTAKELGFDDPKDPEQGIHAGIKYFAHLLDRLDPTIPFRQRVRFALAAYNAGVGHVSDARRIARRKGWDPNRWFGNVEKAMPLLQRPRYYRKARYGYCRGSETVRYVSEIQNRYDNYVKLFPR